MLRSCTMLKSAAATCINTTRPRLVVVLTLPPSLWKCPSLPSSLTTTTRTLGRRRLSSNSSSSSSSSTSTAGGNNSIKNNKFANEAERMAYLTQANATMEQYHNARQLMKRGKLPRHASHPANNSGGGGQYSEYSGGASNTFIDQNAGKIQLAVVSIFFVAFACMPFLGKRIAQDAEFRKRYIPSWYDYTVPVPEHAWTREELYQQQLIIEQALRRRAAAGDFAPNKLQDLQKKLGNEAAAVASGSGGDGENGTMNYAASSDEAAEISRRKKLWDKVHPGLDDDETANEDE
jgi:hypothetical protein